MEDRSGKAMGHYGSREGPFGAAIALQPFWTEKKPVGTKVYIDRVDRHDGETEFQVE